MSRASMSAPAPSSRSTTARDRAKCNGIWPSPPRSCTRDGIGGEHGRQQVDPVEVRRGARVGNRAGGEEKLGG